VATGGFVSDRDMLRRHGANLGEVEGILSGSGPMSTGSGHRLVEAAGAEFTNMADIWLYPVGAPDPRDPSGNRGLMVRGLRNEIWVNSAGRRFHNELERGHSEGGLALLNQPGRYSWGIADSREISSLVLANDSYYGSSDSTDRARRAEFLATSSHVRQAASLGQLAAAIQVPTAELRESVEAYNVAVRAGADVDPMTGRDLRGARTIETGALTAIQYRPLAQKNLGGVRTDLCCRVMTSSGRCFIGLYAAGEVAGMAGGHINGASGLEGTMFGPSLYSGRIAGAAAAADIALGGTQRPH
jgi:predicted oxidoreductase